MRFNGARLILRIGRRHLADDRAVDLIDTLATERGLVHIDWSDGSCREYGLRRGRKADMPVSWKWDTIEVRAVVYEVARQQHGEGWTTALALAGPLVWLALYVPWICLGLLGAILRLFGIVLGEILMVGAVWMCLLMSLVTIIGMIAILPDIIRMFRFRSAVHRELVTRGWM